jgi:hypothetical protein
MENLRVTVGLGMGREKGVVFCPSIPSLSGSGPVVLSIGLAVGEVWCIGHCCAIFEAELEASEGFSVSETRRDTDSLSQLLEFIR